MCADSVSNLAEVVCRYYHMVALLTTLVPSYPIETMNRTLLAIWLAVALVALPACDDGGDLASPSGDEPHRTVFSNKSITGSHLQIDGTVETTADMEGRVKP